MEREGERERERRLKAADGLTHHGGQDVERCCAVEEVFSGVLCALDDTAAVQRQSSGRGPSDRSSVMPSAAARTW